jgi:predicted O-methyltransferase YrrM
VTLESNPVHAAVARENILRAELDSVVDLRIGRATDTLGHLLAEGMGPFDFIFIDADKAGIPEYFDWSLRLSRPGSVIVVDNVIRNGAVADAASADASVLGVRRFFELLAADPRVSATAVQTVGSKGYDGFALMVVNAAPSR